MSVNQSAGARIWIGSSDEADAIAEFAADSWTEINEVENMGEFGDESSAVTFAALKDARVKKFKGTRDAGTMALVCGDSPVDPGQRMLEVVEKTKFDYNFKVQLNDALTVGGAGSIHYFRGKVMSARRSVADVNGVVKLNVNIGINSEILSVDPT